MALIHGRKIVTAAGTPEVLTDTSYPGDGVAVAITAEEDNTGYIVVGGSSTVDETLATRTGVPLAAGATVTISDVNPADIWIDSNVNGDGVTYLIRTGKH